MRPDVSRVGQMRWIVVVVAVAVVASSCGDAEGQSETSTVPPSTTAAAAEDPSVDSSTIPNPTVRYLQQILTDLGYPPGPIDGLRGMRTTQAVEAFQADNGLDQTGTVDRETLQALFDASEGSRIAVVQALQTVLAELGYYSDLIDGIPGSNSIEALRSFQADAGLEATGDLDAETFDRLIETYDQQVTQQHIAALEASGVGGGAPEPPKDVPEGALPSEYLQQGDTGPEVQQLQQRLAALGYRPGSTDGEFGAATASAVMAFQKTEGLQRDSIVGPEVLSRLDAPQGAGPMSSEPGPRVEVDLDRQVMFAIAASGAVTTINVSTGSGRPFQSAEEGKGVVIAHTPIGEFVVQRRIDGLREAPLGTLYRPLYFDGGWAIHGNPHVPGYPASHGCVRTADVDQDFVFDLLADGDPVWIYGNNPPPPADAEPGF